MKTTLLTLLLILSVTLVACGPAAVHASTQEPVATEAPTTTSEVFNPLPADQHAFEAVRELLAHQLGIDPLSITLVEVTPQDWSDSCLGLGGPAESCLQAITPGFLVKVQAFSDPYEFHTDQAAEVIRQVPQP